MFRRVMIATAFVTLLAAKAAAQVSPQPAPRPTIASLVAAIDDDPDILHADFTPAVWGLCGYGLDGARAVLPLLDAASETTRMHASRALECAVANWFGWQPGRIEDPRSGARRRYEAVWRANGGYDWNAAPAVRRATRDLWAAWLAARVNVAPPPPDEPSTDAIRAALAPAMPAAQACGASGRVFATITFARRGDVQRVRVHGVRGRVARCIERALGGARVPPFAKRSSTLSVSVSR